MLLGHEKLEDKANALILGSLPVNKFEPLRYLNTEKLLQ